MPYMTTESTSGWITSSIGLFTTIGLIVLASSILIVILSIVLPRFSKWFNNLGVLPFLLGIVLTLLSFVGLAVATGVDSSIEGNNFNNWLEQRYGLELPDNVKTAIIMGNTVYDEASGDNIFLNLSTDGKYYLFISDSMAEFPVLEK
jgi:hypothetical protein